MKKINKKKASVLVFSLIVLFIVTAIALGMASTTVIARKMAMSTGKSAGSFQSADSGAETALKKIKDFQSGSSKTVGDVGNCSSGVVTGNIGDSSSGSYSIYFYKKDGDSASCSDNLSDISKIKSTGTYSQTARAVEVSFEQCPPTVDYGGDTYNTIKIGSQCWLASNLNVGSKIPGTNNQGSNCPSIQKYCYGDSDSNCNNDGGLYQWDQAMCGSTIEGAQGICPTGWHISTDAEQYTLENYLKDSGQTCDQNRLNKWQCLIAGTRLKTGGDSKFNARMSGNRHISGSFSNIGSTTFFWSSSKSGSNYVFRGTASSSTGVYRNAYSAGFGFSVRCTKD